MTLRLYRVASACWVEWASSSCDDVASSLEWLRFARHACGEPLQILLVIPEVDWRSARVRREHLDAALPALQSYCRRLFVSLAGGDPERLLLRGAFAGSGLAPNDGRVSIFDGPDEAFRAAQAESPHHFLALRRMVLRESYPPRARDSRPSAASVRK